MAKEPTKVTKPKASGELDFERIALLLGIVKATGEHAKFNYIQTMAFQELAEIDAEAKEWVEAEREAEADLKTQPVQPRRIPITTHDNEVHPGDNRRV